MANNHLARSSKHPRGTISPAGRVKFAEIPKKGKNLIQIWGWTTQEPPIIPNKTAGLLAYIVLSQLQAKK